MINKRERRLIHLVDKLNWIDEAEEKGLYKLGIYTNKINKIEDKISKIIHEIVYYQKLINNWNVWMKKWGKKKVLKKKLTIS
jgi:hypothetical protein